MQLGKLGVWTFLDAMPHDEAAAFARRIESQGYGALWIPEAVGRDPFSVPRLPRGAHRAGSARDRHRQHLRARRDGHARQPEDAGRALRRALRARARRLARAPGQPALREHEYQKPVPAMSRLPRRDAERALPSARSRTRTLRSCSRRCGRRMLAPRAREGARRAPLLRAARAHGAGARDPRPRTVAVRPSRRCCWSATPTRRAPWRAPACRSTSALPNYQNNLRGSASATTISPTAAATGWSMRSSPGATRRRSCARIKSPSRRRRRSRLHPAAAARRPAGPRPARARGAGAGSRARRAGGRPMSELTAADRLAIQDDPAPLLPLPRSRALGRVRGAVYRRLRLDLSQVLGRYEGAAGIRQFCDTMRSVDLFMRHLVTNIVIDGDGERAQAAAYVLAITGTRGSAQRQSTGLYDDELVKRDGRWLLHRRRLALDVRICAEHGEKSGWSPPCPLLLAPRQEVCRARESPLPAAARVSAPCSRPRSSPCRGRAAAGDDDDGWTTGHPGSAIADPDEIPFPDAKPRAHDEIQYPDAQPRAARRNRVPGRQAARARRDRLPRRQAARARRDRLSRRQAARPRRDPVPRRQAARPRRDPVSGRRARRSDSGHFTAHGAGARGVRAYRRTWPTGSRPGRATAPTSSFTATVAAAVGVDRRRTTTTASRRARCAPPRSARRSSPAAVAVAVGRTHGRTTGALQPMSASAARGEADVVNRLGEERLHQLVGEQLVAPVADRRAVCGLRRRVHLDASARVDPGGQRRPLAATTCAPFHLRWPVATHRGPALGVGHLGECLARSDRRRGSCMNTSFAGHLVQALPVVDVDEGQKPHAVTEFVQDDRHQVGVVAGRRCRRARSTSRPGTCSVRAEAAVERRLDVVLVRRQIHPGQAIRQRRRIPGVRQAARRRSRGTRSPAPPCRASPRSRCSPADRTSPRCGSPPGSRAAPPTDRRRAGTRSGAARRWSCRCCRPPASPGSGR